MKTIPSRLRQHQVMVETLTGSGGYGDTFAAPAPVMVFRVGQQKLVRSRSGEEVVSSATLYVAAEDMARFTPESKVTWGDHVNYVAEVGEYDEQGFARFGEVFLR